MTTETDDTQSVVLEREYPYSPEKVWRALTEPHLIAEWLMKNDFAPRLDHAFELQADWGSVSCKVLRIEPIRLLAYSWAANGLESVVTWTLEPSADGTVLRMEQTGFQAGQLQFRQGAKAGWPRILDSLAQVLDRPN